MFEVWKLSPYRSTRRKYTHPTYRLVLFARVKDLSLAKSLIIEQTKLTSEYMDIGIDIPHEMRDHFIQQFCFTNDTYVTYRRFFLGRPAISFLRQQLKSVGILLLDDQEI